MHKILNDVIKNKRFFEFYLYFLFTLFTSNSNFFSFFFFFFFLFILHSFTSIFFLFLVIQFCSTNITLSNSRFAHKRLEIATYVEIQRRRKLNIINANSNVDHTIIDLDVSKSKLIFLFTIFISFFSSRTTFHDDKIISIARKTYEEKHADKKMSRIKKRKVVHKVNTYFYDNLYNNLFLITRKLIANNKL
jgi:hypothetical protein